MSAIVIDTHVLIWDQLDPGKLSVKARRHIREADQNRQIVVCEISLWEIASLMHKKRLVLEVPYIDFIRDLLLSRSCILQGINPQIAELAVWMDLPTKDPADRLIAATSVFLQVPLITADSHLRQSQEVETIW